MITVVTCSTWPELRTREVATRLWQEHQAIADLVPARYADWEHLACIRGGRMVPRAEWPGTPTAFGDFVTFVPLPGGPETLGAIWSFTVTYILPTVVATALSFGVQALIGAPKEKSFEQAPDQTSVLEGVQNTSFSGAPIPIVYGQQLVAGNFLSVLVEGNNPFLTGQKFGNLLDVTLGVCEGEIDEYLTTKINGNPLATYNYPPPPGQTSPVQVFYNVGTLDQPSLGGLGAESTFPVQLELPMGTGNYLDPSTWIPGEIRQYTTTQAVDRVRVNILHPEGLVAIHHSSGQQQGQTVQWQTRFRVVGSGSGGWSAWALAGTTSNVTSPFITSTEIPFPARDSYDVEVRKFSVILEAWNVKHRIMLDSVSEIFDTDFTYPGIATVRLRIEAGKELQGALPTITHEIRGRKIVKWDGIDPDDPTFVDAFPYSNPAWVALDVIRDGVYAMGRWYHIENAHLPDFLELAEWCDELVSDGFGGTERRCEFDAVFDGTGTDGWARLEQIGRTCRAAFVLVGDLIKVKVNKPRAPVAKFSMGNIVPGTWSQSWISSALRPTRMQVRYLSRELGYQIDEEGIDDEQSIAEGLPQRVETIEMLGIARRSQALREARFALNLAKLTEVVGWHSDIDGIACEAGDIVLLSHDVPGWGTSGRVAADSARGLNIALDRDITLDPGVTYQVLVRHLDNSLETRTLSTAAGTYPAGTELAVTVPFDQLPAREDLYALGRVDNVARQAQITSIRTNPDLSREFEAVIYDERIHEDGIGELDEIVFTDLPDPGAIPPCPGNLAASQSVVAVGGGISFEVRVSWTWPSAQADRARVYYRDLQAGTQGTAPAPVLGSWLLAGVAHYPSESFTHLSVTPGLYEYTVILEGIGGGARPIGSCSTTTIEVSEATGVVPDEPTGLALSHAGDELIITWDPVTNASISHYLVRRGAHWVGSLPVGQVTDTQIVTERWAPTAGSSIVETFFVRAVSFAGVHGKLARLELAAGGLPVWLGGTVDQWDEGDSSWPGGLTNLVDVSGRLELVSPGDFGQYITDALDTGALDSYRIGAVVHFGQVSPITGSSTTVTSTGSIGASQGSDGPVDPGQWTNAFDVHFQVSQNGLAWSDWSPLITQTVQGATVLGTWVSTIRYIRVRITITPSDPTYEPYLEQLYITAEAR